MWKFKENEFLVYQFENGSSYEMFVIKTYKERGTMVDHLLHKVSRLTKFIIDCGATVSVCLPEHIIVDHLSSRTGWRSHAKYQFPCAVPA